ncbi:uncharacterized protein JCM15063_000365 [Sporobolomyces koalae]|uniref:uncharacterized protein n=1 Tax=Sporobolomyces koalae TaxID=500713 RepID=UPI00317ED43B
MTANASTRSPSPQEQQCLIILAGVVGSGKSTLSAAWTKALPNWVRVNQDDLGDRRTCEQVLRSHLSQGRSVVLDRQNFDRAQRRTWLEIGSEYPHLKVAGMVMGTSIESCRSRLLVRQDHPTIDNPQLALSLLDKFTGLWEEPSLDEGFDQLMTLPPLPPAGAINAALVTTLIALLFASPPNPSARQQRQKRTAPPRSQSGFGTTPAGTYSRPDGFVDDGTWRPPTNRFRAPPSQQQQHHSSGPHHPPHRAPIWNQPGSGAYKPPPQHAWTGPPPPPPIPGYSGPPPHFAANPSGQWQQGSPHVWGTGHRIGGSPSNPGQTPPPPPPPL